VVDGTDPELITELGIAYLYNTDYNPFELLKNILFFVSAVSISKGEHPKIVFEKLCPYFGYDIQPDIDEDLIHKIITSNDNNKEYILWLMETVSVTDESRFLTNNSHTEKIIESIVDDFFDDINTNIKISEIDIHEPNSRSEYLTNWIINTPPVAALCILYMNEYKAVQLLNYCDVHTQAKIITCIAHFTTNDLRARKKLLIEALEQLQKIDFTNYIPNFSNYRVAHLISMIQSTEELLNLIKEADENLYTNIHHCRIFFTDIQHLCRHDMNIVLEKTGIELMAQALAGIDDTCKKTIIQNIQPSVFVQISKRLPILKDIDQKHKQSIKAQQKIVDIVINLIDTGEIRPLFHSDFDEELVI